MRNIPLVIFSLLFPFCLSGQLSERLDVSGYFQGNPVFINADLPPPLTRSNWMEYRLQNRLNIRLDVSESVQFYWQMRTRAFFGDLVRELPGYASGIDVDDGLVNMSWMVASREKWVLHYIPDRLYFRYTADDWDVRIGRQRVNWGINTITNPNDIFNIYSFYDFDYRERPGSDAIRVQRYLGISERVEFAASPSRNFRNSIFAGLYGFNWGNYDIQVIGGYYRNRLALGGGWAGSIEGAGFKGELMYYADFEKENGNRATNFVAAISGDYMFASGLFVTTEFLFNADGGLDQLLLIAEDFAPDNPSLSKYQIAMQLTYPVHPLVDLIFATIYYPDEAAVFLSPGVSWSVIENLDIQLLGQAFVGRSDSVLSNAANLVTASVRYSY